MARAAYEMALGFAKDCRVNRLEKVNGYGKILRETSVLPIYDGGNMGMQRRRVHGILADPLFNPRAIMEDDYVKFEKHHEAIDTLVS
jgi:nitroalkane oxidase